MPSSGRAPAMQGELHPKAFQQRRDRAEGAAAARPQYVIEKVIATVLLGSLPACGFHQQARCTAARTTGEGCSRTGRAARNLMGDTEVAGTSSSEGTVAIGILAATVQCRAPYAKLLPAHVGNPSSTGKGRSGRAGACFARASGIRATIGWKPTRKQGEPGFVPKICSGTSAAVGRSQSNPS